MTAAPTPTRTEAVGRATGAGAESLLARQARRERAARIHARSLPIVPVRTRGMTVDGANGRRYLDCLAGAGPLVLGHSHPVVLEAIRAVPDTEAPARATPIEARFVETLFATLPPGFAGDARILFCGPEDTDAVDAAIGLAQGATGRADVLVSAGLCRGALPRTGAVTRLPYPNPARSGDSSGAIADLLADAAARGAVPSAVVLEAVRGDGEMVTAPDRWMREIRRLTDRYGIPLIVDETQTGLARTGAFWAVEHSGIVPDAIVVAQAAGGSLPLAAVVARCGPHPRDPGAHPAAFRGNQIAMAAGTATIRHIRENRLDAHAARIGTRLAHGLRRVQAAEPMIGEVRGRGLMIGIELVDPDPDPDPDAASGGAHPHGAPALAAAVRAEALDRGLIIGLGGRDDTVLRLLPPLTMTEEQAEAVLTRLADAVAAVGRRRRKTRTPPGS
ncbi:aminotransferase class III-fold pyridoxal phosphate-dependent enzyme [Yinghuangia sp. ASG 101]|uniref:aminotransferase class III-fold pyridoxal phosphate-dependent enzyme n=1 Tax=Yinghuangia sp. ASG 101 TaxID=2896848 RepID=UPI001E2A6B3C|nr:aminotransferase class III-fold pyridoxal phosphate-dependent enzyme [Yinghuangia sp. ASG 101]UGQ13911.1 aminotransferase class III-fold pyridoxal phosphate-dependent enzyme [Yinghuangia sp. ASG 101]